MSQKNSTLDQVYSGTAAWGRVWALFGAIMATILAGAMGAGAVYLIFFDKSKDTATAQGTITSASCTQQQQTNAQGQSETIHNCQLQVTYTVDGKQYVTSLSTSGTQSYASGQSVTVAYNPQNPAQAELKPALSASEWGYILIGLAFFILLVSWGTYWLARRFKAFAAFEGVQGAGTLARNIL